jgi:carboxyl-terminal processing protease
MKKFFLFFAILFSYLAYANDSLDNVIEVQVQKFRNILETVKNNYYKEDIDIKKISENAFNSALQSLDKFSSYYPAPVYENIKDSYKGTTRGIGVQFFRRGDSLIIFHIVKNSPADSVGLELGDKVIYINHEYCIGKDAAFANKKILESPNGIAVLTIKRGDILKEYTIPTTEIEIPSLISKMKFGKDIGYLRLSRFSLSTFKEFTQAFDSLLRIGCKYFAIDLRGNQGGYLDEAVKLCYLFLKKGDTVVTVSGKKENTKVYIAEENGKYFGLPLIVLVDENTASASEIFASSMQDNDRAIVVGTRTFGKGLVLRTWEFKDGSAFRITTAEYLSPLGRKIQKEEVNNVELSGFADLQLKSEQKENIEALIKKFGGLSSVPIYYTKKGRLLLGGGGIFPDYIFISDTLPVYLQKIRSNGFLNDFVLKYFIEDSRQLSKLKEYSFSKFVHNFNILDNAIFSFRQYLVSKNALLENYFNQEYQRIILEMKATLGYILFGDIGYYSVLIQNDNVLNRIVELRNEVENLVK